MKIRTGIAGMSMAIALLAAGCKTSKWKGTNQALNYCVGQRNQSKN